MYEDDDWDRVYSVDLEEADEGYHLCDTCHGEGRGMTMVCYGGSPYEKYVECPDCDGNGQIPLPTPKIVESHVVDSKQDVDNSPCRKQIQPHLESTEMTNANQTGNIASAASALLSNAVDTNKKAATTAAVLETGRIANRALSKMVAPKLPMMVRGYLDTPVGRLLLANAVKMAFDQFKPDNATAQRLANGMIISAYQEAIQSFDIEGMLDDLLSDNKILKALAKTAEADE